MLLATSLWRVYVSGSPVVFYIDNDAARSAYIQGVGSTRVAKLFTETFVQLEFQLRLLSWFGRVPSHSNIADEPSRLDFANPLLKACKRIHIEFPSTLQSIGDGIGSTGEAMPETTGLRRTNLRRCPKALMGKDVQDSGGLCSAVLVYGFFHCRFFLQTCCMSFQLFEKRQFFIWRTT